MSPISREERFWNKVAKGTPDECWLWTASLSSNGYGFFTGEDGHLGMAHRWLYQHLNGPLPSGVVVHHRCHVRNCVNPAHLEAVTQRANVLEGSGLSADNARKTHCKRGHEFTPENTYITPARPGVRHCRECRRLVNVRQNAKRWQGNLPNSERTHCPHGHPYEGANLIVENGRRICRACRNAKDQRRNERTKAERRARRSLT